MDINKLMRMRQNLVHYVHLVHIYAPCIVPSRVWNDKTNMMRDCTDNEQFFRENVLTISDEAFIQVFFLHILF